jgi:hypothetical protein
VADDEEAEAMAGGPSDQLRQLVEVASHRDEFEAQADRPAVTACCVVQPLGGGFDCPESSPSVERPELVGFDRIGRDADAIDARRDQRFGSSPAQQLAVRLEPDPAARRHGSFRQFDELLEAAMEHWLADAVEDQRVEMRKGRGEAREGLCGHVALDEALPGRLLHAHGAPKVAPGRHLHEELGGIRAAMRRQSLVQGVRRTLAECGSPRTGRRATALDCHAGHV